MHKRIPQGKTCVKVMLHSGPYQSLMYALGRVFRNCVEKYDNGVNEMVNNVTSLLSMQ